MKRIEKLMFLFLVIAEAGVVFFWIFGFNDMIKESGISIVVAGIAGFMVLLLDLIDWRRSQNYIG